MSLTTPSMTASTTTLDRKKYLSAKLLMRALRTLVAAGCCDEEKLEQGSGDTAYFIRYNRMYLPTSTTTEGTDPSTANSFSPEQITVQMEQWADFVSLSDQALLMTRSPLIQVALDLLADNAQSVIDREIQNVWLAGTNVQYGDGTATSRSTVTPAMKLTDEVIMQAYITMVDNGAPQRDGPPGGLQKLSAPKPNAMTGGMHYIAVCGPQVLGDIRRPGTSLGSFVSVAMYQNAQALYNFEVGQWQGMRWIQTNFIPKFTLLGNTTTAVTTGNTIGVTGLTVTTATSGGSLTDSTTYYYKVTRKDLLRGFEEAISIEHTTGTGAAGAADDNLMTFAFPSTAGFVYNVYFGSSTGDSNLKLAGSNIAASGSLAVAAVPSSTTTAPANVYTAGGASQVPVIHPVYVLGREAVKWVGLQNLVVLQSGGTEAPDSANPLGLRKFIGWKFMHKAVIVSSTRLLRLEVASSFT